MVKYLKITSCYILTGIIVFSMLSFNLILPVQQLKVSKNKRYLIKENGEPFFWLGDTAWQLFLKLNREEADQYLADRYTKKFTVIQTHLLGFNISDKNAYGVEAFHHKDFNQPNETYWKHADYIINKAESTGLYMALIPAWARSYIEEKKDAEGENGVGKPALGDTLTAYKYGWFLGNRYKTKHHLIWVLGGDIWGRKDAIYAKLAQGLTDGAANGDPDNILISFHPPGGTYRPPATSSSEFYHNKPWLDFNMIQSGHNPDNKSYEKIANDYALTPTKPTIDAEPCYEQHPIKHSYENGAFDSWNVRRRAYWSVFAGAFGYTYGANGIWQMDKPDRIHAKTHFKNYWYDALNYEGGNQMAYVRNLIESRPYQSPERVPDQHLLLSAVSDTAVYDHIQSCRAADYSYIMVYTTNGKPFSLNISKMKGKYVNAWWYNPRDGRNYGTNNQVAKKPKKIYTKTNIQTFSAPGGKGPGSDWVLVLDEASKYSSPPGQTQITKLLER